MLVYIDDDDVHTWSITPVLNKDEEAPAWVLIKEIPDRLYMDYLTTKAEFDKIQNAITLQVKKNEN